MATSTHTANSTTLTDATVSCADDETRGKVAIIGGMPDRYVADSFAEFVDRYTTDWASVIPR